MINWTAPVALWLLALVPLIWLAPLVAFLALGLTIGAAWGAQRRPAW